MTVYRDGTTAVATEVWCFTLERDTWKEEKNNEWWIASASCAGKQYVTD